jgi:hypothetical protein
MKDNMASEERVGRWWGRVRRAFVWRSLNLDIRISIIALLSSSLLLKSIEIQ